MPRTVGGPARDLPSCPRPGHEGRKVVKDGRYGSPPRQRFRCVGPDGFHRFVPKLPRQVTHAGVCDTCDSTVPAHRGPVAGRWYAFPVREVAAAFAAVGSGASYQQAALRARARADRTLLDGDWGGAVVAEWLNALGQVVLDGYAETSWPETVVLDSTRFMARNTWTGGQSLAFNVLGAYGYPADGQGRPRLWALAAYHQATAVEWADFLRRLDTTHPPRLVVTDGADEITNAVREVWTGYPSPSFPVPFCYRCEHHLRDNVVEELAADKVTHWGSIRMNALNEAFHSPEKWSAFKATVWPKQAHAYGWVKANDEMVTTQVAVRRFLPDHHSTAALEAHLGKVRDFLDARSFVLRNQARTTTMLGLVRLHLNGHDDTRRYTELLRTWLDSNGGAGPHQRRGYDTGTSVRASQGQRQPSSLRR